MRSFLILSSLSLLLLAPLALVVPSAHAHCEIPCGIYTDSMRIEMLHEDIDTVEKSMQQIEALSGKTAALDQQQLVRWVTNKEEHCEKIQEVATQYFMFQRVKPAGADDADYVRKITMLHEITVEAMKAKQTLDSAHIAKLRELVDGFAAAYFDDEDLEHIRQHRLGED